MVSISTNICVPRERRVNTTGWPWRRPMRAQRRCSRFTVDHLSKWCHSSTSDTSSRPRTTTGHRWWTTYIWPGRSGCGCLGSSVGRGEMHGLRVIYLRRSSRKSFSWAHRCGWRPPMSDGRWGDYTTRWTSGWRLSNLGDYLMESGSNSHWGGYRSEAGLEEVDIYITQR